MLALNARYAFNSVANALVKPWLLMATLSGTGSTHSSRRSRSTLI